MKPLAPILLAAALLAAPQAHAAPSGYELYTDCLSNDHGLRMHCLGYVGGVVDTLITFGEICGIPSDLKVGKARDLFLAWATAHPQYLPKDRGDIVVASLKIAYPCHTTDEVIPRTSSAPRLLQ